MEWPISWCIKLALPGSTSDGFLVRMCPKRPALYNVKQAGEAGEASSRSPRAKLGG